MTAYDSDCVKTQIADFIPQDCLSRVIMATTSGELLVTTHF